MSLNNGIRWAYMMKVAAGNCPFHLFVLNTETEHARLFLKWKTAAMMPSYFLQAARETGALQAAKSKLEKQVEELTWRLKLEKRMRVR